MFISSLLKLKLDRAFIIKNNYLAHAWPLKVLEILKTFGKTGSIKASLHILAQAAGYVRKTKKRARLQNKEETRTRSKRENVHAGEQTVEKSGQSQTKNVRNHSATLKRSCENFAR